MLNKRKQCWHFVLSVSTVFFISDFCQAVNMLGPDFEVSLQIDRYAKNIQSKQWLSSFRQLYEKNNLGRVSPASQSRIPCIIHHIWLGSKLPAHYAQLRESWREHHPEWIFVFWTDTPANYDQGVCVSAADLEHWLPCASAGQQFVVDVASFSFANRSFYDAARNYGERADILRYEILYRFGGLYVDTDCVCFKPFDLLHQCYDFYAALQPLDTGYLQMGIGILGVVPHHPLMARCVDTIKDTRDEKQIVLRTGPIFFTKNFLAVLAQRQNTLCDIVFPPTFFYPCGYTQQSADVQEWLRPESFSAHYWEGSWLKRTARTSA